MTCRLDCERQDNAHGRDDGTDLVADLERDLDVVLCALLDGDRVLLDLFQVALEVNLEWARSRLADKRELEYLALRRCQRWPGAAWSATTHFWGCRGIASATCSSNAERSFPLGQALVLLVELERVVHVREHKLAQSAQKEQRTSAYS